MARTRKSTKQEKMVVCRCSDKMLVKVPMEGMRHSHLFDRLCDSLGSEDGGLE